MEGGNDVSWLSRRLRPHVKDVIIGLTMSGVAGLISTLDPLLMRHLIDDTLPKRRLGASLITVILITLSFVGRSGISGLGGLVSFRVAQSLGHDLRVELLAHMTSLSAEWHERTLLGEKLSRIERDVQQISQFGAEIANAVFRTAIFFFVNLAIMFSLNWRMTLSVLPLLPLFFWVVTHFRSRIKYYADQSQMEIGKASGSVTEHLGAVPQIQILGAEEVRISRTVGAWIGMLSAQWAQRRTEIAFSFAIMTVLALASFTVLGLGVHEYLLGALSLGGLIAFYAYVTRVFEPISTAMEWYSRSQRMLASTRRVREVMQTESSVPDNGVMATAPSPLLLGLSCEGVTFAYSGSDLVLRDVSLHVGSGEHIALVGKSGSGKSTLSRLLARMADPSSGRILLEGTPTTEYTLRTLRRIVSYVPQQPVLFSGTVRDNLLYANADATDEEISAAIEAAQLLPVLARLPNGLDTVLYPEAVGLSGGERQRLAVARALLRRPDILVLDESTSALDLPTEQAIFRAIAGFRSDLALIVISHRLRSLTWIDRIILLDSGSIVAQGTHGALYAENALYRSLYEREGDVESERANFLGEKI